MSLITPRSPAPTSPAPGCRISSTSASARRWRASRCWRQQGEGPFDLVFIDADKPNNPHYLDWALKFAKPGTVIVADNVVRDGTILDPAHRDARVQGVRGTYDWFAREPRVTATAVQTVGSKGYDGFAVGLVTG